MFVRVVHRAIALTTAVRLAPRAVLHGDAAGTQTKTMSKSITFLSSVVAVLLCAAVGASTALGVESCSNEVLRSENTSGSLPDCRAYELVSADSNHVTLSKGSGRATPDGDTVLYVAVDAPENARSGEPANNLIRASRDPAQGWKGVSLAPPVLGPVSAYRGFITQAVSADLSAAFYTSDQPLAGGAAANGYNLYTGRADGTYQLLTPIAPPNNFSSVSAGNADFSHVYFQPSVAQLPSDPLPGGNTYSWTAASGLRLVGILPDGTSAPSGASLAGSIIGAISADASRALFVTHGKLYLRIDDERTVEVSTSQRSINLDPNPGPALATINPFTSAISAGITAGGTRVLFVAHSELTNDADTGSSAGVATDAGADLYSYDVASGLLADLTVDTNPADSATGANIQNVLGATADGSFIYFTATGDLAAGATPGQTSLYVWHDGTVSFVAAGEPYRVFSDPLARFYVTPDGRHAVFASSESLTGYDNTDPATGQRHLEIFEATFGAGLVCVSCRVNGTRPTADTLLPEGAQRIASDDGRRVFFQSSDAVVPQAASGLQQVFEYEDGSISPISRPDSSAKAILVAVSSSGDDVFFESYDDPVPGPTAGDDAMFDARVGGGFPLRSRQECSGDACRGPLSSPPVFAAPSSNALPGAGNLASPVPTATVPSNAKAKTAAQIRAEKLVRSLNACKSKHNKKRRSICEKSARKKHGRRN